MILPADFDLDRPDAELVQELVDTGRYEQDEATDLVEMLRAGDPIE